MIFTDLAATLFQAGDNAITAIWPTLYQEFCCKVSFFTVLIPSQILEKFYINFLETTDGCINECIFLRNC